LVVGGVVAENPRLVIDPEGPDRLTHPTARARAPDRKEFL